MAKDLTAKVGRKAEEKPERVGEGKKAGPVELNEVEGQSAYIMMQCPWCGGMNRCYDTDRLDVWSCAWCGNLYY
jgi:hypothetical protein